MTVSARCLALFLMTTVCGGAACDLGELADSLEAKGVKVGRTPTEVARLAMEILGG